MCLPLGSSRIDHANRQCWKKSKAIANGSEEPPGLRLQEELLAGCKDQEMQAILQEEFLQKQETLLAGSGTCLFLLGFHHQELESKRA